MQNEINESLAKLARVCRPSHDGDIDARCQNALPWLHAQVCSLSDLNGRLTIFLKQYENAVRENNGARVEFLQHYAQYLYNFGRTSIHLLH